MWSTHHAQLVDQVSRLPLAVTHFAFDTLSYLLDNIYIRFGNNLYKQIVGIPMGTNCAPLVADFFLFCYERDFMPSLSDDSQADIIEAFIQPLDIKTIFFILTILISKDWSTNFIYLSCN